MSFSVFGLRRGPAWRRAALAAGTLLVSLSISAGADARTHAPAATKLTRCSISKVWHSLGPTYVETLSVHGVSCGTGESLIRAYNACRLKHGGLKGTCTSKVDGYRFTEKRQSSPDQFIGLVTAANGNREISFTYSENT